jgi:hypothetical protein
LYPAVVPAAAAHATSISVVDAGVAVTLVGSGDRAWTSTMSVQGPFAWGCVQVTTTPELLSDAGQTFEAPVQ